jgi:hypothetical protein
MTRDDAEPSFRLPVFQGICRSIRSGLGRDVLAGFTLAALAIPGTMGYTKIIGTPVITGLYTILIPMAPVRHFRFVAASLGGRRFGDGGGGRRRSWPAWRCAVPTSGLRCAACWR